MMRAGISSWAIRRPISTIVLFIVLTVWGFAAFQRLPVNANPRVDFPVVNVSVTLAGAAPAELETQVTRRVELAVASVAGIRHITSTIADGLSTTTIEFRIGIDPDRATNDAREAVSAIRSDLPQTIEEPVIARYDVEGGAILYYAVRAPAMSEVALSWFVDDAVARELLTVTGVQRVQRLGGVRREIRVELEPARLAALGVTADQVNAQIRAANANVPGGRSEIGQREQSIRVIGAAVSVDALADTSIALPGGRSTILSDIARVTDGGGESRERALLDGEPVVGFAVYRSKGSSDTVVAEGVQARIAEIERRNPGVQIQEFASTVDYTRKSYEAAMHTLLEGALLTVVVVFLFLRNWRATAIAAIAMPLSILPAFAAMELSGFTLNSITLLALTLVIGILVDDVIVEIENIDRHIHLGKRPYRAAIDAADAIGFAVVAITLTIVVVFAPVSFIGGVIGEYFEQFGLTVVYAVLASLLVARLLTPLMAAYLLKPKAAIAHEQHAPSNLMRRYLGLLDSALRRRKLTLRLGAAVLVGSFVLIPLLPSGFLPTSDRALSLLNVELPPGTRIEQTEAVVRGITRDLGARDEVDRVFVFTGGDSGTEARRASFVVRLKPAGERDLNQRQFERAMRAGLLRIPDFRFSFQGESGTRDVSILLTGDDPKALVAASRALEAQMRGLQEIANTQSTEPLPRPELLIRPRLAEAARLGVDAETLGTFFRVATVGEIDANTAKFNLPDRQVPIRVLLAPHAREDLDILAALRVSTPDGRAIPLETIAQLDFGNGEAQIDRLDRKRRIAIEADLNGVPLGSALDKINALPALKNLPVGVRPLEYGDAEYMTEMFEKFSIAMAAAVLLMLAVLVLLFKDFLQPFTILVALPLSIGGAMTALLLYGAALDLPAVIGVLMLMGIVTKNSILLVEFAIEKRRSGLSRHDALIQAGAERARPIIMTTISMVAGMVPAALGIGADAGFRAPMAIAVIGGLVSSTVLSLVFVPVVFTVMDDLRAWAAPHLARLTSVTQSDRIEAETSDGLATSRSAVDGS